MSNYTHQITLTTQRQLNWALQGGTVKARSQVLLFLGQLVSKLASGAIQASGLQVLPNGATGVPAGTVFVVSSATGTVSTVINATSVDVTADASDTVTATLAAAAVNANATVSKFVQATNISSRLTLTSVAAGTRLSIMGVTFTAVSGTPTQDQWDISGTDTQDAASLVAQILAHPQLSQKVFAMNVAGVVYVFPHPGNNLAAQPAGTVACDKATIALLPTTGTMAVQQFVLVQAKQVGELGNCCTTTASAGGGSYTASSAKMAGGTGTASVTQVRHNL